MSTDIVFDTFDSCLAQIQEDFAVDLTESHLQQSVLFRGEHAPYQKTESSMKRLLTAEDGKTMKSFYYVSPFIDFEDLYSEFHSEVHGLSVEQGIGFLQHYGMPTDLLDFSPSLETTRFFSAYGCEKEPVALIGVFPRANLERYFTLTDLSSHPVALRPQRQVAYVGRPPAGIIDLKSAPCTKLLQSKWYRFRKGAADLEFARSHASHLYPSEAELSYFFGNDLIQFFQSHSTSEKWSTEQRELVNTKLTAIRKQLQ